MGASAGRCRVSCQLQLRGGSSADHACLVVNMLEKCPLWQEQLLLFLWLLPKGGLVLQKVLWFSSGSVPCWSQEDGSTAPEELNWEKFLALSWMADSLWPQRICLDGFFSENNSFIHLFTTAPESGWWKKWGQRSGGAGAGGLSHCPSWSLLEAGEIFLWRVR